MKRLCTLLGLCVLLAACEPEVVITQPIDDALSSPDSSVSSESSFPSISSTSSISSIPSSVRIAMPFASQAPTGNWDPPYDEACEEASLIIVHYYLDSLSLDADSMDYDIREMVEYEESVNLPIDIDMRQLADVARNYYKYNAEVLEGADVSIERIEQELSQGNPVIVPLAGQDIGNPYYSGDGPPYHVLVIVGYDSRNFITHDVGTKRGENYVYKKEVIMDAIHDWVGSEETIREGPRRLLVVTK